MQFSTVSAIGIEHLHTSEVRMHDAYGSVHNALVERIHVVFSDQLLTDLVQQLCICEFRFKLRMAGLCQRISILALLSLLVDGDTSSPQQQEEQPDFA